MALTIHPAVSRVSNRRWAFHVGLFALGVAVGALGTYVVCHALFDLVARLSPTVWLAVALPIVGLAALHDLGLHVPVPYPTRKQVPEWLRHIVAPGVAAAAYGAQLGTGFLTRFTYSTHAAFVALLAPQSPGPLVAVSVLAFAASKAIVILASPTRGSYHEIEPRLLHRYRVRGQTSLRLANACLAAGTAAVLITNL